MRVFTCPFLSFVTEVLIRECGVWGEGTRRDTGITFVYLAPQILPLELSSGRVSRGRERSSFEFPQTFSGPTSPVTEGDRPARITRCELGSGS